MDLTHSAQVANRHEILCGNYKISHIAYHLVVRTASNIALKIGIKLLVAIFFTEFCASILLVFLLLVLNLTIAVGTINLIAFYANMI